MRSISSFRILVLVGLGYACAAIQSASIAHAQMPEGWQAQVTQGVEALRQADLLVGGVVGFTAGDLRPVTLGFGEIQVGSRFKPDENSLFEIGSVTKEFTALALADLVLESKGAVREVRLDDAVADFLPQFKGTFMGGVTLRQLATHTSGLERMPCGDHPAPSVWFCFNPKDSANPYVDYTWPKLQAYLLQYAPAGYDPAKPRPIYKNLYSNTGFGFLGYILAQLDGSSYEQLIKNRITSPLGMKDTVLTLTHSQKRRFVGAYDLMRRPISHWDFGVLAGAGGLRSTVKDLLAFGVANLDPDQLLAVDPANLRLVHLVQAIRLTQSENLGWDSGPGARTVYKDGGTDGFSTLLSFTPSRKIVQVSVYNMPLQDSFSLLGLPFGAKPPELVGAPLAQAQLVLLLGQYMGPQGSMQMVRVGRFLDAVDSAGNLVRLKPSSPLEFDLVGGAFPDGWNTLSFVANSQGVVTGLVLHPKNKYGVPQTDVNYNKE